MTKGLQEYDDKRHHWFNQAELQSSLLAESQEANSVGLPDQTTGAVQATGAYRLAPDLRHDVPLPA